MDHLAESLLRKRRFHDRSHYDELSQFLGLMHRICDLLHQRLETGRACRELVRIIIEESDFENCSILLWDGSSLKLAAAYGIEDMFDKESPIPYHKSLSFAFGEGIAGRVFDTGRASFIGSQGGIPLKRGSVVRPVSLACLPLLDQGVLNLSTRQPVDFSASFRCTWERLCRTIGYILARPERAEEVSERREEDPLPELAIDLAPQGLCLLDPSGSILRANRSIEALHGCRASDLTGRSPAIFFQEPRVFEALLRQAQESGREEASDVHLVRLSGELYLADAHLVRLDRGGETAGFLLIISDQTKRRDVADRSIRTEKLAALGTMAGGVSHDFNNLLMTILGHIQLMLPRIEDEETRRRLKNIEKAVYDGSHTVRRLQKFTDRESGNAPVTVDVSEAIADVVELTRPRWKNAMEKNGKTIDFKLELEPQCMGSMHASDLREVLTNLLFNAIEAMPDGGSITLRSRSAKGSVTVEVIDSGIGMSREVSERIFDPFYTTKGVGNSGLGLSVSWGLVSRAGGEIQVRSKPGSGTTFTITLPASDREQRGSGSTLSSDARAGLRLLVVDDDEEVLEILRDMLRLKGHSVVAVSDGTKAMEVIELEEFDLVVTDLGMPVVSGWEIARKVKERKPRVPVVMLTGWGAQYEGEDLSERGVDVALSKPLSWEKLLATIDSLNPDRSSMPG